MKKMKYLEKAIEQAMRNVQTGDFVAAIPSFEIAFDELQKQTSCDNEMFEYVVWMLANLYGATANTEKSIQMHTLFIDYICQKYQVSNLAEVKMPEEKLSQLISLLLGLGKAYVQTNHLDAARRQFEMGYTLSFMNFGEFDERTLKQEYNMACINLYDGNEAEAIRQLKFCYFDMREHLGTLHPITKKAEETLGLCEQKPDELYREHLMMKKYALELMIGPQEDVWGARNE